MPVVRRRHGDTSHDVAPSPLGAPLRWLALGLALSLAACATPPPLDDEVAIAAYEEANDPLEPMNRTIFEINRGLDAAILKPLAVAYRALFSDDIRNGVRNITRNLNTPQNFIHDVLQGEPERARDSAARFAVNSLAGAGGMLDVMAMDTGVEGEAIAYHDEDMGQTFGVWGIGEGPYLMLPLFGPSNIRDAIGKVGDIFLDPFRYLMPNNVDTAFSLSRRIAGGIDTRSRLIEALDEIERTSIDFYVTIRSLYRQHRAAEILNDADGALLPAPAIAIEFEDDEEVDRKRVSRATTN